MGVRVVEFNKQGKERIAMSYSPGARLRALIARPGAVAAPGVVAVTGPMSYDTDRSARFIVCE